MSAPRSQLVCRRWSPSKPCRSYFTFPQLEPSHLEVNALSIFVVWPLPAMEPCDDPFRCSWSRASTSNVAVLFIPSDSQESFPFAAVLVEVMTVGVHSLLEAKSNFCFSMSSLVTHFVCVVVRVCAAELAFILSSKRARCSGLNLSSMPAGIGSPPSTLELIVVSQRPGLMFKGTTLTAGDVFPKSGFWGFCWANIGTATIIVRTETV